jgi:aspartyl-tRNA(Asn)/glutamyl-tRNA(Gln) amidotransferase subunit C
MQFQDEDIKKLARLSRLSLREEDVELFRDQLTSILSYVDQIATVTIKKGKPDPSRTNHLRVDKAKKSMVNPDTLLSASAKTEEGRISVSSVK